MTFCPAGASSGGVADTVIVVELPAFTSVLAAFAWASFVVTVQPVGPLADADTVWSSAEPFWRVRSNENGESLAPVRVGVGVVRVMSPATFASTPTVIASVLVAPSSRASTFSVAFVTVVSPGTSTSSRAVPALPGPAVTPLMTKPPPWRVAFQPVGTPDTDRPTVPVVGAVTLRSKLALDPGATAIDGYGVVTLSVSAAKAAGASPANARAAAARAIAGR